MQKGARDLLAYVNRAALKTRPGLISAPATFRQQGEFFAFDFPHVFTPVSSHVDNALVIRACLDYLVYVNSLYLQTHAVKLLYQSGVYYARTRIWDSIPALYKRGFGDCKSLTGALVAEYRHAGTDAKPVFRFNERSGSGTQSDYHVLVQTLDGFEDPSKLLGMPHGADF